MPTRRNAATAALCAAVLVAAVTGCSSGFDKAKNGPEQEDGGAQKLKVLIATSGNAETAAVEKAAKAWEKKSGNTVEVQIAKDINQQLGQAFAGNRPPDAFYVNSDQFANYAKGGSLYAYGDQVPDAGAFSAELRQSFTYDGKLVCLPKDSSTLGLAVNTELWKKAGLTEADYPENWEELEKAAGKLTKGGVTGLVTSNEYQRLGAFMKQAGGWVTDEKQTKITADSPQNAEALKFVQKMLRSGSMKYAQQVDAGWAGEAFGKGKAAMTIEGNWLAGAMKQDFPDVKYDIVELPEGPEGKATLAFSNCWGVAADSAHRKAAVDLVRFLTSQKEQLASADATGLMPSRTSALKTYAKKHPESAAWVAGIGYAQGPVTVAGSNKVLAQFNTDLASLATRDPKALLTSLQRNGEQVVGKGN